MHDVEISSIDLIYFHNKFLNINNKILDNKLLAPKNKRNIIQFNRKINTKKQEYC